MAQMAKVLVVVAPGAEEIELMTVADVLVRSGCEVTLASTTPAGEPIRGSRELPIAADCSLSAVIDEQFNAVYLPGGFGSAETCRDDPQVQSLIARQLASEDILAVICACPISLIPGGHAQGKRLTCYPALSEQLRAAGAEWIDQAVVRDGNLITSQGPGTAMDLAFTLAAELVDDATAAQVKSDMLLPA